jgi:hypothetical protein
MSSVNARRRLDLRRAAPALVAALLALAAAPVGPAGGQAAPPAPTPATTPEGAEIRTGALPDPDPAPVDEPPGAVTALADGLDQLEVSSPRFDRAERRLKDVTDQLARIREVARNAARDRQELGRRDTELTRTLDRATRRVERLEQAVQRLRGELRDLAVATYVSGREFSGYQAVLELDAARHNELGSQAVMVDTVNADLVADLRRTRSALEVARTEVTLTTATRAGIRARIREVRAVLAQASEAEARAGREVFTATAEVERWRRLAEVEGTDMPLVILDGYVRAAQILALIQPECGIPWWALAGIGRTESHHGSAGGAEVRADGSLTRPILGIPLDGSGETASITLEDGRADRAQGPMQFITSTWAKWAFDATGDDVADVQNTYDAAAGAAAYLCAGGPMRTDDDFRRGYFSYNHSGAYVEVVLSRAHEYEAAVELPTPD